MFHPVCLLVTDFFVGTVDDGNKLLLQHAAKGSDLVHREVRGLQASFSSCSTASDREVALMSRLQGWVEIKWNWWIK